MSKAEKGLMVGETGVIRMQEFLGKIVKRVTIEALALAEHGNRKIVREDDLELALQFLGLDRLEISHDSDASG